MVALANMRSGGDALNRNLDSRRWERLPRILEAEDEFANGNDGDDAEAEGRNFVLRTFRLKR